MPSTNDLSSLTIAAGNARSRAERDRDHRYVDRRHGQVGQQRATAGRVAAEPEIGTPLSRDADRDQHRSERHHDRLGGNAGRIAEPHREHGDDPGGDATAGRDQPYRGAVDGSARDVRHLRRGADRDQEREPDQHHRLPAPRLVGGDHRGQPDVPQHGRAAEERDRARIESAARPSE
jgi:hypothetical protein